MNHHTKNICTSRSSIGDQPAKGRLLPISFILIFSLLLSSTHALAGKRDRAHNLFLEGKYEESYKKYEKVRNIDKDSHRNYILYNMDAGLAAMYADNYEAAMKHFRLASTGFQSDLGKVKGIASLPGKESVKIFKGEPFEKAMVHFYIGLMAYKMGDYWTARAGFANALLADKASQENFRDDFAVAHYMLGRTYQMVGDSGNARIAFKKVSKVWPNSPLLNPNKISRDNLIIVAELGTSPIKFRTGPQESMDDFRKNQYVEQFATIDINDRQRARSYLLTDLSFEASTRGMSQKDTIQASKGMVAEGVHESTRYSTGSLEADLALLATDIAFQLSGVAKADIRQWSLLPGEIQIMSTYLKPGSYTADIRFYGIGGGELYNKRIEDAQIEIKPGINNLYFYRSVAY